MKAGDLYDYAPPNRGDATPNFGGRQALGRYRFLGHARDGRTYQQLVVYEGVGGDDDGKWFACSLYDWELRFLPAEKEVEVEATPTQTHQNSAPTAAQGGLSWYRYEAQKAADETGETFYVVNGRDVLANAEGPFSPCIVRESGCNALEKKHGQEFKPKEVQAT